MLITAGAVIANDGDIRKFDGVRYDVNLERTFEGIATNTGYVVDGFMYFALKTRDYLVEIQMGPKDFVERSGFKLKAGESITVIGMPTAVEGRAMVLAREIRGLNTVFVARDRNGEPRWDPNRPVQMDTEFPEIFVCYNPVL
jgi:hypothetical protein